MSHISKIYIIYSVIIIISILQYPYDLSGQTPLSNVAEASKFQKFEQLILNKKDVNKRWAQYLKNLDTLYKKLHKPSIKLSLAFTGDDTKNEESFSLNSGLEFELNKVRSKMTFATSILTKLKDGALSEEVSEHYVQYENYFSNNGHTNLYINVSRFSDKYLSLDRRYELTVGSSFDLTPTIKSTGKTTRLISKITKARKSIFQSAYVKSHCSNRVVKDARKKITHFDSTLTNELKRRTRIFNFSPSVAVQAQFEEFTLNEVVTGDTIVTSRSNSKSINVEPELNWRLLLSPNMTIRLSDDVLIELIPQFKIPIFGETRSTVISMDESGTFTSEEFLDLHLDLLGKIKYAVNKNFSVNMSYRYLNDRAPANEILFDDDTSRDLLLKAQRSHHLIRLTFEAAL